MTHARKRQTAQANPRPANEFRFCLRCARWGSRQPDPDCSHAEHVDLTSANRSDIEFFEELAERLARQREQMKLGFSMLRTDAKRLVAEGKARETVPEPPSSGIVRLTQPDPRDPRYEMTVPRQGEKVRWRVRISTDPANQN
jgi:hypothetical protein